MGGIKGGKCSPIEFRENENEPSLETKTKKSEIKEPVKHINKKSISIGERYTQKEHNNRNKWNTNNKKSGRKI